MRIVYPESRRFRISFVVERVCRSANTGCPVPSRGPDFLCRIRSCGLPRVRAAASLPNRSGTGQGGGGFGHLSVRSCAVSLQSASMCRHAGPECPSGGATGAGASSLPATDSTSLFFSRHRRRKRGCGYPLLGLPVRGRSFRPPSRRVFRRPLRRGGRALPGQAPGIWSRMAGVLALRDRMLPGRPK